MVSLSFQLQTQTPAKKWCFLVIMATICPVIFPFSLIRYIRPCLMMHHYYLHHDHFNLASFLLCFSQFTVALSDSSWNIYKMKTLLWHTTELDLRELKSCLSIVNTKVVYIFSLFSLSSSFIRWCPHDPLSLVYIYMYIDHFTLYIMWTYRLYSAKMLVSPVAQVYCIGFFFCAEGTLLAGWQWWAFVFIIPEIQTTSKSCHKVGYVIGASWVEKG